MRQVLVCVVLVVVNGGCDETKGSLDAQADLKDSQAQDSQAEGGATSCMHLKQGPFVDVNAGTDAKSAAEVKSDGKAYRLPLSSSGRRWVKYVVTAKGILLIYSDTCMFFNAEDGNGGLVKPMKTEMAGNACGGITCRRTLDLAAGTHFFKWGPSGSLTSVTMVLEQFGH